MPGAFAKVLSYGVYGIEPYQVTVELDVTVTARETEPQSIFQIVGLPEGAVKESRERVRAVIGNAGFWNPVRLCKVLRNCSGRVRCISSGSKTTLCY